VQNRVSNNVGGVKDFLSTQQHALEEGRHFARVEDVPIQPSSLAIGLQSGIQSGPCVSSIAVSTMIPRSNSSLRRSGTPQSIARCFTAHYGHVRAVPRADRSFSSACSPLPCASSSSAEWLACGSSRPSQSSARVASPEGPSHERMQCHGIRTVRKAALIDRGRGNGLLTTFSGAASVNGGNRRPLKGRIYLERARACLLPLDVTNVADALFQCSDVFLESVC